MSELRNYQGRVGQSGAQSATMIDEGLRSYNAEGLQPDGPRSPRSPVLLHTSTFMMATTNDPSAAAVQLGNGTMLTSLGAALYQSPLQWVVIFAPVALVFFMSFKIQSMSVSAAQTTFWVYAALMGLSLSSIFLIYTGASIVQNFLRDGCLLRRPVALWLHHQA